ncbi:MAG: argininosuccinate synthase [bacterium]|nr:argininosuccinate synthase [bacterium]
MKKDTSYIKVASYEGKIGQVKKVVLLYSGGLDTSCMLKWIQDAYGAEVITLTLDLGQQIEDLEAIKKKALKFGAKKAYIIDAKNEFADEYLAPLIKANGAYQGNYYISTVSRPLLAKWAVKIAEKEKADAIAHGCTGKGNDQVRIEATALTLNPKIKIIAPVREWSMGREEEIEYAKKYGIPVPANMDFPYSVDDNMWGMTWEGGEIEDPALIPPIEKFLTTYTLAEKAPNKSELAKLTFKNGLPISLNGKEMKLTKLIGALNKIAGKHGVGVVHHIEDRLVGLKVRGVYELPAAHVIITAHKNLEKYVCTRVENELKSILDIKWAYLVYGALWLEPVVEDINAFNDKINEKVNGAVTVKLYKGSAEVVAMESPNALYDKHLATFMKDYSFNQNASAGFIEIYSLQMKLANQVKNKLKLES